MPHLLDPPSAMPTILPLGDSAVLVRFASVLDDGANRRALQFARALENDPVTGVVEVVPSLVSVLVRYDPFEIAPVRLAGELSLLLGLGASDAQPQVYVISVRFGGEDGPDLEAVAAALDLSADQFIERHNGASLRVLATGFAPGFVYCGFHDKCLVLPRRAAVRPMVPAGSVLFAAGQTAVTATGTPTGWHVIGRTDFRNFDAARMPPNLIAAGDKVRFEVGR